jgi:O-antigen ligase
VGYLLTRIINEIVEWKKGILKWTHWDNLFLTIVLSAFSSSLFAGMPGLEEWKGYLVFLTGILTGWFLSRAEYSQENYYGLFKLIILSTIPPLLWGLYQYLIAHTKNTFELNSVGHVNHSAIYLVIIYGASLAWFLSYLNLDKLKIKLYNLHFISLGILSFICYLGLIYGQSRAAYGIGIILSILIINCILKSKKNKMIANIFFMVLVLLSIILKPAVIEKQITNQKANNVLSYRDKVWNVSLEASRFSPLLGIGLSNWHFITLEQLKKSVEDRQGKFDKNNYFFPGHSHNLYLSALVERGIVGLLVTLIFMTFWLRHIFKTYILASKSQKSLCLWSGSVSAWVATFGIGLVNTTFHHEHAILACLFLGAFLSYSNQFLEKKN